MEVVPGYPVMLNLVNKHCVVVGGGQVAARKVSGLLTAGASVTVISPELTVELQNRVDAKQIQWLNQHYQPGLFSTLHPFLVIAATDSPDVNQVVANEARDLSVLVNVADNSAECDFSSMSAIHRPPLTIAISTNGASPALTKWLKGRIEDCIGPEYETLARWLGELRPQLQSQLSSQAQRAQFYDAVLQSDVVTLLSQQHIDAAHARLQSLVEEWVA